jgi:hypothetical protein
MEWATPGALFGILMALVIPIGVIFLVLWIIRRDTIRKQEAVRSPDYWKERPEGRRYPTGWDRGSMPGLGTARPGEGTAGASSGEDWKPPPEGGDPPDRGAAPPDDDWRPPPAGR